MSNLYLTRETAEALWRDCVEPAQDGKLTLHDVRHAIDSLPVVDEVPAEEALERLLHFARTCDADYCGANYRESIDGEEATIRHALRAAQAQAEATGLREFATNLVASDHDAIRSNDKRQRVTLLAQAQADAPPPPDVIRRGHRAMDRIVCAGEDGPDAPEWGDQEVADVRAAMYPLPKEE